jgi:hypothetical protein
MRIRPIAVILSWGLLTLLVLGSPFASSATATPALQATGNAPGLLDWNLVAVGSLGTVTGCPKQCYALHLDGQRLYAAFGGSIHILDGRDPVNLVELGRVDVPVPTWLTHFSMDVQDSLLYFPVSLDGMAIVDVSDPSNPVQVGQYPIPNDYTRGVDVVGTTAYIAYYDTTLDVVDVTDPANPTRIATATLPGSDAGEVLVSGSTAYVANAGSGIVTVDVSNPASPQVLGTLDTPGFAVALDLVDTTLYVADSQGGLRIVDVSDPSAPTEIGSYVPSGSVVDVRVVSGVAYLADASGSLIAVDVSTPTNPSLLDSIPTGAPAVAVEADTVTVYLAKKYGGVGLVDISTPTALSEIGDWLDAMLPCSYSVLAVGGGRAYVSDSVLTYVIDVAVPQQPRLVGVLDYPASDLVSLGDTLVLLALPQASCPVSVSPTRFESDREPQRSSTAATWRLVVVDLVNPPHPVVLGSYSFTREPVRMVANDSTAAVAMTDGSTLVVDFSDPAAMDSVATIASSGRLPAPPYVAIRGNLLVVAMDSLWSYDMSTPSQPTRLGEMILPGSTIDGLKLADLGRGLFIQDYKVYLLDLSDPSQPRILSNWGDWSWLPADAAIQTKYLLIADRWNACIHMGNITNPSTPYIFGEYCSLPVGPLRVVPDGAYVYVADGTGGLVVLQNVFVPTATEVAAFEARPGAGEVELVWTLRDEASARAIRVFRDGAEGLRCLTAEPLSPSARSYTDRSVRPGRRYRYWIEVSDASGIVARSTEVTVEIPAARAALLQNRPNPFNPSTAIPFVLPEAGRVRLRVFDLEGRLVRTLVDGVRPAGRQEVRWDGRDDRGRPVSSGVYLVRLEAAGEKLSRKMVLLR